MTTMTKAAAAALIFAGGCVSTSAIKSPNANLAQYRTFSFYEPPEAHPRQLGFERSPAGQVIRNQIANDLTAKGMTETSANPDVLVAYHSKLQQKTEVNDWGYGGFYWGMGPVSIDQYTQGTLFIDLIDPKTKEVVWRGTASAVVNHPESPNPHKLASAVDKLMKKFPSELASAGTRTTM